MRINKALRAKRLEIVKKLFFDGITALCLSLFGPPGGKEHREIAQNRRSVVPDEPAQPEKRVRAAALNNPEDFFDRRKTPHTKRLVVRLPETSGFFRDALISRVAERKDALEN
jgi:hypothetical protein